MKGSGVETIITSRAVQEEPATESGDLVDVNAVTGLQRANLQIK